MAKRPHRLIPLLKELKRRKVVGALVAYTIAAAGVVQLADVVAPRMNLPESTVSVVILLSLLGLPLVTVLAWVYDVVPDRRRDGMGAEHAAAVSAALLPTPVARPAPPNSLAVLPFANLSPDPENEYFADGVTEDVISHLSKIGALSVISRTSVLPFRTRDRPLREIGAALGAGVLLEGSVRRAADRVRIAAQLVDAATGQYLWTETYDRNLTDVFAIQTDVALQIAAALQARLSSDERSRIGKEPTHSLQAYRMFLQGRQHQVRYTTEGLLESIRYFERATELDPEYALAYASVAMAHTELGETGAVEPEPAYRQARKAVATALALDGSLAAAHCVLGHLKALADFDYPGAEASFKRALELSPSDADTWDLYGRLCSALGRYDEAVAMERRAQELDPLAHRSDLATALLRAGRYEEAAETAEHGVEQDPDYDRGHATLGWAYLKLGRNAEGIAELERAVALSPANTTWLAQLGAACGLTGDTGRAHGLLDRLRELSATQYVAPYHMAYIHTGLGEHDRAIDYLEQAVRHRAGAVYGIKGSFLFAPLHDHPRFKALLEQLKLA